MNQFEYSIVFNLLDKASPALNRIKNSTEKLKLKMKDLTRGIDNTPLNSLKQKINNLSSLKPININFNHNLDKIQKKLQNLNSLKQKINNLSSLKPININFNHNLDKIQKKLQNLKDSGQAQVQKNIMGFVTSMAAMYTITSPVRVAKDYETAFKDIKKAIDGTSEEYEKLNERIKSSKWGNFAELSRSIADYGKMGFNADLAFIFAEQTVKGSKALDMSMEETSSRLSEILNKTNQIQTAKESVFEILDLVAHLDNKLVGDARFASDIMEVWKRSAANMGELGLNNEDMAVLSAFLRQTHESAELGASGFKILINRFKDLGRIDYIDKIKVDGLKGFISVLEDIDKSTTMISRTQDYGSEASNALTKMISKIKDLKTHTKTVQGYKNAVIREGLILEETFQYKYDVLVKKFSNLMASLGEPLKEVFKGIFDVVTPVFQKINEFVVNPNNQKLIKFLSYLAIGIGSTVLVATALGVAFGVVKIAVGSLAIVFGTLGAAITAAKLLFIKFKAFLIGFKVVIIALKNAFISSNIAMKAWAAITATLSVSLAGLKTVISSLFLIMNKHPFALIVTALTALSVILYKVYQNFDRIKSFFIELPNNIKNFLMSFKTIRSAVNLLSNAFQKLLSYLQPIKSGLSSAFQKVKGFFDFSNIWGGKKENSNDNNKIKNKNKIESKKDKNIQNNIILYQKYDRRKNIIETKSKDATFCALPTGY